RAGPSDEAVAPAFHLRACVPRRGCKHEVRLNRMTHAHPLGHEVRVALLRKIQFDAIHHLTCSRVRAPTLLSCARTATNRTSDRRGRVRAMRWCSVGARRAQTLSKERVLIWIRE